MSETPASSPGTIERTVVHIVRTTTVAGIIGGYVALSDLKTSNAVLESQINALTVRIDDLKSLTSDRYTGSQALRDLQPVQERILDHEKRLRLIEQGRLN